MSDVDKASKTEPPTEKSYLMQKIKDNLRRHRNFHDFDSSCRSFVHDFSSTLKSSSAKRFHEGII